MGDSAICLFQRQYRKAQEPRNNCYINSAYQNSLETCFSNNPKDFGTSVGVNWSELTQCIWVSTNYCAILQMDLFYYMDHSVSDTPKLGQSVFLNDMIFSTVV